MTDSGPGDPPGPHRAGRRVRGHDPPGAGGRPPQAAPGLRRRTRARRRRRRQNRTTAAAMPPRTPAHRRQPRRRRPSPGAHGEHAARAPSRAPRYPSLPRPDPLRVANCSGFYGDRISAAKEMVDGGPIDVLTGDWLAELTMMILAKGRMKDPDLGLRHHVPDPDGAGARDLPGRGHRGGQQRRRAEPGRVAPRRCTPWPPAWASRRPSPTSTATTSCPGSTSWPRPASTCATSTPASPWPISGWSRSPPTPTSAAGASPPPSTAAPTWSSPAASPMPRWCSGRPPPTSAGSAPTGTAWPGRWSPATSSSAARSAPGGNYAFFGEVPGLERPGFPIAEIAHDGSFVVTKHPGTGGLVSESTVTAQLLYEIQGLGYYNPDVVVAFDSIEVHDEGDDRVRVSGVVGLPAPETTKVAVNYLGGFRNSMTFVLTGLDVEAKAELAERTLWSLVPGRSRGVRLGRRAPAPQRPRRPRHQRGRARRAAHHGDGPRQGEGGSGLLEHRHRDGAGQLPRPVHDLPAGRRVELRRLLAGAGAR